MFFNIADQVFFIDDVKGLIDFNSELNFTRRTVKKEKNNKNCAREIFQSQKRKRILIIKKKKKKKKLKQELSHDTKGGSI